MRKAIAPVKPKPRPKRDLNSAAEVLDTLLAALAEDARADADTRRLFRRLQTGELRTSGDGNKQLAGDGAKK